MRRRGISSYGAERELDMNINEGDPLAPHVHVPMNDQHVRYMHHTGALLRSAYRSARERATYNSRIAKRNLFMLTLSIVVIVLYVILNELVWEQEHYVESPASPYLVIAIIAITVLHALCVIEYHLFRGRKYLQKVERSYQSRKARHQLLLPLVEQQRGRTRRCADAYSTFRGSSSISLIVGEILLLVPFPLPFIGQEWAREVGLLMFIRLYWFFKVFRDHSSIYKARLRVKSAKGGQQVGTLLALRSVFYTNPVTFLAVLISSLSLSLGYAIFILEREAQPQLFTYGASLFLSFSCMLTGYANDSFGVYSPSRWATKFVCLASTFSGFILFALLLELIYQSFHPTKYEESAVNLLLRDKWNEKVEHDAAILIQRWWRLEMENVGSREQFLLRKDFRRARQLQLLLCSIGCAL